MKHADVNAVAAELRMRTELLKDIVGKTDLSGSRQMVELLETARQYLDEVVHLTEVIG